MATYGTDLVVLATGSDGSGGTWGEFVGWASGGAPGSETENYIQGSASYSQTFGNAVTGKSIAFDAASDISSSIPTGDVVIAWVFMGAPANMYGYASGGHRFGIGASLTNFDMWSISGDDRPPNPYGGWWSVAIDPRVSTDYTGGTGSGGAWRYFGSLIGDTTLGIRVKIAKGNPHAVDGMRMGRGEIYAHGTGGTFTLMAASNDASSARWGLFQDTGGGTFRWKGLMSLGITATALTLTDSNKSILIEDMAKVTSTFNKIEFNHVDTDVTWTNINITSLNTVSKGDLEMIANCTLSDTGGVFTDMGTFIYQSGATITGRTYRRCGQVTQDDATFDSCVFDESPAAVALVVDDLSKVTDCTFNSDGTGHAVNLGTISTTQAVTWDNFESGYATQVGTAANRTILVSVAVSQTLTINVADGGASTPTYYNTGSGDVNVVAGSVTVQATITDASGTEIENALVYMQADAKSSGTATTDTADKLVDTNATFETDGVAIGDTAFNQTDGTSALVTAVDSETALSLASDAFPDGDESYRVGGPYPDKDVVTIVNSGTTATVTHTGHGLLNNDYVYIEGGNQVANEGVWQTTYINANSYSYTMLSSPSSPTGTITSTFVGLYGLTNSSGLKTTSRVYDGDQLLTGWARKSSSSPYYIDAPLRGTVSSSTGLAATGVLVSDE